VIVALAWRNLWRQPRRTLLSSLAIAFASAFLIFMPSLQNGSYNSWIENTVRLFDGYGEIQQPGYLNDPEIRSTIKNYTELQKTLEQIPGMKAVGARAISFGLLATDTRSYGAQIAGVQPQNEPKVSTVATNIRKGRYLQGDTSGEIVVGETLARNLGASVGSTVTLLGMGRDGSLAVDSLTVVGEFATGIKSMDRLVAEMPLRRFQDIFSMPNQVHALVMGGNSLSHFKSLFPQVRQIAAKHNLVALDWKQLQPGLLQAILLDISTAILIYVAMVVVVSFSLLNSLLMSVLERTREFGMLMALGMRPGAIGRMVWLETILLLALGLTIGILLGYGVSEHYAKVGIHFQQAEAIFQQFGLPGAMYPEVSALTLLAGPGVIAFSIILAGAYPIIRIYRLEPVTAMRRI
jgi:putative ABC transport system permease protein